ncbi:PREDICTED: protein singed wings 2 [Diuraphis noxia]|uniref:protein singed wings 2 n=1 Tax=Diuraphis noxia TaxID=143948 RepID=UPI000763615F|nr:PREDICTED: protein singed wings 2 [Diuraphis noxia]
MESLPQRTLNLSHLHLEHVKYSVFKYLSSLEVLDLSYNKFNHLYSPTMEYLPKLKQIWLAGDRLKYRNKYLRISILDDLLTNRYYTKLLDIHLDYNRISSISILEGSHWLTRCRVMSFKGNNLTKVPTYALDNAFQRNRNIVQLYLGANPWRCNCLFAPAFQDFLIKYKSLIMDLSDIKCSYQQNDEYYMTPVSAVWKMM